IDYDSDDASFIRYVSKKFKREKRMPNSLVSDLANTTSLAQEAWVLARQNNDYALFQPHLQKVLDLTRQKSE
ncbi:MAG TPA: carboxypeptidase, partial [Chloroflexi bacterium]|nr:carboxypeptidase [Chloroflexota bacterium]